MSDEERKPFTMADLVKAEETLAAANIPMVYADTPDINHAVWDEYDPRTHRSYEATQAHENRAQRRNRSVIMRP